MNAMDRRNQGRLIPGAHICSNWWWNGGKLLVVKSLEELNYDSWIEKTQNTQAIAKPQLLKSGEIDNLSFGNNECTSLRNTRFYHSLRKSKLNASPGTSISALLQSNRNLTKTRKLVRLEWITELPRSPIEWITELPRIQTNLPIMPHTNQTENTCERNKESNSLTWVCINKHDFTFLSNLHELKLWR